jgi:hypothetical protein
MRSGSPLPAPKRNDRVGSRGRAAVDLKVMAMRGGPSFQLRPSRMADASRWNAASRCSPLIAARP